MQPDTTANATDILWGDAAGAAYVKIPLPSFKKLRYDGKIPYHKIDGYNRVAFYPEELDLLVTPA
jgi:hypothetical protein